MTKKLEIGLELAERTEKLLGACRDAEVLDRVNTAAELRALLAEPKMCDCNQGRLPCTCKDTPPLIQTLHANGDRIAMEANIAQQAQRIADLERGRGEPVAVVDEGDEGLFIDFIYGEDGNPLQRGDVLYRELPAPVAVYELQAIQDRHEAWKAGEAYGIESSARLVEKRMDDYVNEHGSHDPETGAVEFPGTGAEYVGELVEISEAIRAIDKVKELNQ